MSIAKFGKLPSGDRLVRIKKSPHYQNGMFQNISPTPQLAEGYSMPGVLSDYLFKNRLVRKPKGLIPFIQTELTKLLNDKDILVWFGHSSYYMQLMGVKFLVDPVFSGNASPLPDTNKAFAGADFYKPQHMPQIDYLVITHDHYDHLDYETIIALLPKVKHVICPLGVGSHFEYWGYPNSIVTELEWYETYNLQTGFDIMATPARHFSGRSVKRNKTLWCSYVLQTPVMKFFLGGDSGYDRHFKEIGERYGPFDLAIMENGQYDKAWEYIHSLPEQTLQATVDLQARSLLPVHSSKFMMANHPWDEPLRLITEYNKKYNLPLLTPLIGQVVNLKTNDNVFTNWWELVM